MYDPHERRLSEGLAGQTIIILASYSGDPGSKLGKYLRPSRIKSTKSQLKETSIADTPSWSATEGQHGRAPHSSEAVSLS